MIINEQNYRTKEEKLEYVRECECGVENGFNAAANALLSDASLEIVTLSGPSCSGKTTAAKKIISGLEAAGKRAHVVSIDDFYRPRRLAKLKKSPSGEMIPDYESIDSINLPELEEFVRSMDNYGVLKAPVFDFEVGECTEYRNIDYGQGDIIIFEGIQAIYPEVTELLYKRHMKSVHISVSEELSIADTVFRTDEIRLMRRLVRDYNYRAATPEQTLFLWESVRENEISSIEPYAPKCDIRINSLLGYEVGVLKPFLFQMLTSVDSSGKYAHTAGDLLDRTCGVVTIPRSMIPENSIYREFLH